MRSVTQRLLAWPGLVLGLVYGAAGISLLTGINTALLSALLPVILPYVLFVAAGVLLLGVIVGFMLGCKQSAQVGILKKIDDSLKNYKEKWLLLILMLGLVIVGCLLHFNVLLIISSITWILPLVAMAVLLAVVSTYNIYCQSRGKQWNQWPLLGNGKLVLLSCMLLLVSLAAITVGTLACIGFIPIIIPSFPPLVVGIVLTFFAAIALLTASLLLYKNFKGIRTIQIIKLNGKFVATKELDMQLDVDRFYNSFKFDQVGSDWKMTTNTNNTTDAVKEGDEFVVDFTLNDNI